MRAPAGEPLELGEERGHVSQKSSLMRHIFAWRPTWSAAVSAVSPGERLSTIDRPVRSIARRMASISRSCS
jgi:hypothetical protein